MLAIDTSTSLVGAACIDSGAVISEVVETDARRHGELLAPAIVRALAEAGARRSDLASIAIGVGPGPFTGLRVGITTGLVMGAALGIPVVGVCSVDALAFQVHESLRASADAGRGDRRGVAAEGDSTPEFLVATDARRKEIYWARYARGCVDTLVRVGGPGVARPADLPAHLRALPAYGRGTELYPQLLRARPGHADVRPGALGQCAGDQSWVLAPEPLYLRRPDAVASLPVASTPPPP